MTLHTLALLDSYKVRWSRETTARDIVQNFYDEVSDFREIAIEVDDKARTVLVRGPSVFAVDYLRYLGATTKAVATRRSAGGFGEGFKIACLVLLRDFGCTVRAGSRDWELEATLQPMKLGRELCYDIRTSAEGSTSERASEGSWVLLCAVDAKLREVFRGARDFFVHPDHPELKKPIFSDEALGVGVYEARDAHRGVVFYRRQRRGVIRFAHGAGLTLRFDDRIAALDADRDRRDLGALRPLLVELAKRLPAATLETLFRRLRSYWAKGGTMLSALVTGARVSGFTMRFPRRWLARQGSYTLETYAESVGLHLGGKRLASIGMPTVVERLGDGAVARTPTAVEAARLAVAREAYVLLARHEPPNTRAAVVDIPNPFRRALWGAKRVEIDAKALAGGFTEGIAEVLAVLAFRRDKSASNADRLTDLIGGALQAVASDAWRALAERWERAATDPAGVGPPIPDDDDDDDDVRPAKRTRTALVVVLAPPGFPGLGELAAVVRRAASAERVKVRIWDDAVCSSRGAAQTGARGIPSVWVGKTPVDREGAPRQVAYAVRTYRHEDGVDRLWPSESQVRAALSAEVARRKPGGRRSSRYDPRPWRVATAPAWKRWQKRHAPAELAARELEAAVVSAARAAGALRITRVWALSSAVCDRARATLERAGADASPAAAAAGEKSAAAVELAVAQAAREVDKLQADIEAMFPPSAAAEVAEATVEEVLALVRAGATQAQALALAVPLVNAGLALERALAGVPLDATCRTTCWRRAFGAWDRARRTEFAVSPAAAVAGKDTEAALEAGLAMLDRVVPVALARHDARDDDGQPLSCYSLGTALDQALGTVPRKHLEGFAEAVQAAWQQELAAGKSELEAARYCLGCATELEAANRARSEAEKQAALAFHRELVARAGRD